MARFEWSSCFRVPVEDLFAFHQRPDALQILQPPGVALKLIHKTGGIEKGAIAEFLLGPPPFRVRWLALHTGYEPNRLFVDEQIKGPFAFWRHRHVFQQEGEGSRLTDDVEFRLRGGAAVNILLRPLVYAQLTTMFRHRHAQTKKFLEGD